MDADTKSLFLQADRDTIALLFHGLAGSSYEVKGLAEFLWRKGISVSAPTLSFHESRELKDLGCAGLETWKKDAENAYSGIKGYHKIIIGGISNGASLAAYLALKYNPEGLLLLSPPVFPGHPWLQKVPLEKLAGWISRRFDYVPRFDYKMVRDWTLAAHLPRFKKLPSHFPLDAMRLAGYVRENLSRIHCPVLIIQGRHDNRVHPKGAEYLFQRIGSKEKKLIFAENSGHVVLLDADRDLIFRETAGFIKST